MFFLTYELTTAHSEEQKNKKYTPDINNVNLAVIDMNQCANPSHIFLFIAAKGVLKHLRESKIHLVLVVGS